MLALNPVTIIEKDDFNTLYNVTFTVQEKNYTNNAYYKVVKKCLFLSFIIVEVRPLV